MQGEESRQTGNTGEAESIVDQSEGQTSGGSSHPPATSDVPGASAEKADALAVALGEAARLKDAWLRTAADFDNFKKRARRESEDAERGAREKLLKGLLPVFDNLERAIQSAQRSADVKGMADGLSMVLRQFVDALGREGISRIQTVGRPFDPTVHEAIQQVETEEHQAGTVIAEVQPGYTQGERLVRPAMVVVAKPKSSDGSATSHEASS